MATKRAPKIAMICSDFTQGSRVSKGSLFLNFRQISIHVKRGLLLPSLKAINSFFLENEIIQKPFLHKCNMHSTYVMQIKQKIIKPLIIIMNSNKARILHSVNGNGPFNSFRIYNPIIASFHYENHILLEQICQTT